MHMKYATCCLMFLSSINLSGQIEGKKVGTSGVSYLIDKVQLPIMYCKAKLSEANRHRVAMCLRKWNRKYDKYCKDGPHEGSKVCLRLKWKMKRVISRHASSKTRAQDVTESCRVGRKIKSFNTKYQYCCEGHIRKKKQRNDLICCRKVLMITASNASTAQCCNKSELSLESLRRAGCCHEELYDEEKFMCYGGVVISKTSNERSIHAEEPNYTRKYTDNQGETHFKEKIQLVTSTVSSPNVWQSVLIGCCTVLGTCIAITTTIIWRTRYGHTCGKRRSCLCRSSPKHFTITAGFEQETHGERLANINSSNIEQYGTNTLHTSSIDDDENNQDLSNERFSKPENCAAQNSETNKPNKNVDSYSKSSIRSTSSQTAPTKTYNLMNSMGEPFNCRHVFSLATRSLQLPNSCVKLTLSEQDSVSGTVECFASTFSCLSDVYSKLEEVITAEETIVSPAVEYVFPNNDTLHEFGCVEMEVGRSGKDLHVWKMKSDQGKSNVKHRQEIPSKNYVDIADKTLDAYYEIIEPGKIRIYMKRFCWLVCTVCQGEHYGFNLAAFIYMSTVPQNNLPKKVRLTMYILDDIQQLKDYKTILHEDDSNLKMARNIELPFRVKLEDKLTLRFRLFEETENMWSPQENYPALCDTQDVMLHRITKCHKQKSNSQPFAMDMYFVSRYSSINADIFIFEGVINITLIPAFPGTVEEVPENRFIVTHVVDFSSVKKAHVPDSSHYYRILHTGTAAEHPESCVTQPAIHVHQPASHVQQPESSPTNPEQRNMYQNVTPFGIVGSEYSGDRTGFETLHVSQGIPIPQGAESIYSDLSRGSASENRQRIHEQISPNYANENGMTFQNSSSENDLTFETEVRRMRTIDESEHRPNAMCSETITEIGQLCNSTELVRSELHVSTSI